MIGTEEIIQKNSLTQEFSESKKSLSSEFMGGILDPEKILFMDCLSKKEALLELSECLGKSPAIEDKDKLREAIFYREELMSTGIGLGTGIPHVRLDCVNKLVMAIGVCRNPLSDYESIDGKPVTLIFMIAAGKEQHAEYLKVLASISSKLKDEDLRNRLFYSGNAEEFYLLFTGKNL